MSARVSSKLSEFVVIVDTREKNPYDFIGFRCDSPNQDAELIVRTHVSGLDCGDYSIKGLEDQVAIERKSLIDAYGTFGKGRDRFERELYRLARLRFSAVVIEASWDALVRPPPRTRLHPKTVFRSVLAWEQRFGIPFHMAPDRHWGQRLTYRMLERFYLDVKKGVRRAKRSVEPEDE